MKFIRNLGCRKEANRQTFLEQTLVFIKVSQHPVVRIYPSEYTETYDGSLETLEYAGDPSLHFYDNREISPMLKSPRKLCNNQQFNPIKFLMAYEQAKSWMGF